jgi:hypothetical protein
MADLWITANDLADREAEDAEHTSTDHTFIPIQSAAGEFYLIFFAIIAGRERFRGAMRAAAVPDSKRVLLSHGRMASGTRAGLDRVQATSHCIKYFITHTYIQTRPAEAPNSIKTRGPTPPQ